MAYGTLNAGTITPGSGNTLTISETVSLTGNATLGGTANALGTVTSGNLSNTAIVYPSGHVLEIKYMESHSSSGNQSVSTTIFYGWGDVVSMSVPTGQSVIMQIGGGLPEFDAGIDWGPCVNWDTTTFSSQTQGTFGLTTGTNLSSKQILGPVMAKYSNTSGSTTTLYVRAGLKGWSSSGTTVGAWYADATIDLARFFLLTRFMT